MPAAITDKRRQDSPSPQDPCTRLFHSISSRSTVDFKISTVSYSRTPRPHSHAPPTRNAPKASALASCESRALLTALSPMRPHDTHRHIATYRVDTTRPSLDPCDSGEIGNRGLDYMPRRAAAWAINVPHAAAQSHVASRFIIIARSRHPLPIFQPSRAHSTP